MISEKLVRKYREEKSQNGAVFIFDNKGPGGTAQPTAKGKVSGRRF